MEAVVDQRVLLVLLPQGMKARLLRQGKSVLMAIYFNIHYKKIIYPK